MLHHLEIWSKNTFCVNVCWYVCVCVCPAVTGTSLQAGEFTDDITGLLDLMMARKMIRFKDGGEVAVHGNARKRTRKHASAPRRQPLAPAWHLATQAVTWSNVTFCHCGALKEEEPMCGGFSISLFCLCAHKFLPSSSCLAFTHRFYAPFFFPPFTRIC